MCYVANLGTRRYTPLGPRPAAPENGEAREKVELRLSGVPGLGVAANGARETRRERRTTFGQRSLALPSSLSATPPPQPPRSRRHMLLTPLPSTTTVASAPSVNGLWRFRRR